MRLLVLLCASVAGCTTLGPDEADRTFVQRAQGIIKAPFSSAAPLWKRGISWCYAARPGLFFTEQFRAITTTDTAEKLQVYFSSPNSQVVWILTAHSESTGTAFVLKAAPGLFHVPTRPLERQIENWANGLWLDDCDVSAMEPKARELYLNNLEQQRKSRHISP
jgi:hypothetical protein